MKPLHRYFLLVAVLVVFAAAMVSFRHDASGIYRIAAAKFFGASLLPADLPSQLPLQDSPVLAAPENQPQLEQEMSDLTDELNSKNLDDTSISNQDAIDDLLEKIDLLQRQLDDINRPPDLPQDSPDDKTIDVAVSPNEDAVVDSALGHVAVSGSNIGKRAYPKLVISEVQTAGTADAKQEYVELYNPNLYDVDLTGWYLQRKTKTAAQYGTFAPSSLFLNEKITAGGYFLVARPQAVFPGDVIVENPLTDNNSLVLKNPAGDVVDKVGWGEATDFEGRPAPSPPPGRSIGRSADEIDSDNNAADFTVNLLSPKAENVAYIAPVQPEVSGVADSLEVVFALDATQTSLEFPVLFTITDLAAAVSSSTVDSYVLRSKPLAGDWHEDEPAALGGAPTPFSASRTVVGQDGQTYFFQVKTKDTVGGESDWLPEVPAETTVKLHKKVLINQIQVEGVTAKDEFIELYNPNDAAVDVSGFSLKKKTSGSGSESNLVSAGSFAGLINPHDYFLVAPQKNDDGSENYTGSVAPALRYSGKTFSLAADNTVLLYDIDGVLLDKVGFGAAVDFEVAAAANPPAQKSIVRARIQNMPQDTDNNATDFFIQDAKPYLVDTAPPRISGVQVLDITANVAKVFWETDEPSVGFVSYGPDNATDFRTAPETLPTVSHVAVIADLLPATTYHFLITSTDESGNTGFAADQVFSTADTLPTPAPDPGPTDPPVTFPAPLVVINEIAWMGTVSSSSDEWMELFNSGTEAVDLTGWRLVAADGTPSINLSGQIAAHSFYLLEHTSDNTVPNVTADVTYSGLLENIGEDLYLYNAGGDAVDRVDCSAGWFVQSNDTKQTMQRKDPLTSGSDAGNWQASQHVGGTPKS